MSMAQNIWSLQKASDYRLFRRAALVGGITSIFWGLLNTTAGIIYFQQNALNVALAVIGVGLLVEGIWGLITPHPVIMKIDSYLFGFIVIWNVVVAVVFYTTYLIALRYAIPFIFQTLASSQSIEHYNRFSYVTYPKPDNETIKQAKDLVELVKKKRLKDSESMIELKLYPPGTIGARKRWKGELVGDIAVFIVRNGSDAIFALPNEVKISPTGVVASKKPQKCSAYIGQRTFDAIISVKSLERYRAWKKNAISSTS